MRIKIIISLIFLSIVNVYAFDNEKTHPDITREAASNSRFPEYLQKKLNLPLALETKLVDKYKLSILSWLEKGSTDEDEPDTCRASNHFHNPLEAWNESYMSDEPGLISDLCSMDAYRTKYSNITWGTGYEFREGERIHRIGQRMGWDDARNYFHKALIAKTQTERDDYFAKTFQALGQVMHLVQDMAVPAHVRNDFESHMEFIKVNGIKIRKWFDNRFEIYIKRKTGLVASAGVKKPEFLDPKSIRLTDFWDTDKFEKGGEPPAQNDFTYGLAEYVNANYFSKFTIPNNSPREGHRFSYPDLNNSGYQICEDYKPNSTKKRKYISRGPCSEPSEGRTVDHFAAVRLMNWRMKSNENIPFLKLWLDDNVHNTYAKELLPLAIGYSASLLDYFFRGDIEISLPGDGFFAFIPSREEGANGFRKISLLARNITPEDEEVGKGSIHLVVHYKEALEDPFQPRPVPTTDFKYIVVPEANGIQSIPRVEAVKLEFDLSETPLPIYATDVYLQVVYKGKLGLEEDAVVVGFKDIGEPTPIDIINDMDRICLEAVWYPAGGEEAIKWADSNGDGVADLEDIFAHNMANYYLLFSPERDPQYVSAQKIHFYFPLIKPGEELRLFILSDYKFCGSHDGGVSRIVVEDTFPHFPMFSCPGGKTISPCLAVFESIRNQTDYPSESECAGYGVTYPCTVRHFPGFHTFRGKSIWSTYFSISHLMYPDSSGNICEE